MSFPRYAEYKPSGVEWLREVPGYWEVRPIKRRARLITGLTPSTEIPENYADIGFPWIRPDDLDESGRPVVATKFLSLLGKGEVRAICPNSTLICCIGSIGKAGFAAEAVSTNQQITALESGEAPRFLYYAVIAARSQLELFSTGNVLRILNSERLGTIAIPVPPEAEQTAIAAFLDRETAKIDALVAEQQKLIALLKEKRQAVISHAVTKGLNPDAPMKPSGIEWLGDVPAHWEVRAIKTLAGKPGTLFMDGDWIESTNIAGAGIRYITTGNVGEGRYKEQGSGFITEDTFLELDCTEVHPGDILISRLNPPIGRACIVPDLGSRIVTSVDNVIFRPEYIFDRRFMVYRLSAADYFHEASNLASGATMQRISRTELGGIRLSLPPFSEQVLIVNRLDAELERYDAGIYEAERANMLLKERRSALISAAVTGQIDVRGLTSTAAAQAPAGAVL